MTGSSILNMDNISYLSDIVSIITGLLTMISLIFGFFKLKAVYSETQEIKKVISNIDVNISKNTHSESKNKTLNIVGKGQQNNSGSGNTNYQTF